MQKSADPLEATAYLRKSLDVLLNKSLICWWARQQPYGRSVCMLFQNLNEMLIDYIPSKIPTSSGGED